MNVAYPSNGSVCVPLLVTRGRGVRYRCVPVEWHVFPQNRSIPVRIFRVCVTAWFASMFPPASPNVPNEFPHRFYGLLHCFSHVNVFEFDVCQKEFGTPEIETGWAIFRSSYINGKWVPEQLHSRIVSARTRESPRDSACNKLWKWVIFTQSLSSINTSLETKWVSLLKNIPQHFVRVRLQSSFVSFSLRTRDIAVSQGFKQGAKRP